MLPARNAFDFVEKPSQSEGMDGRGANMGKIQGHEKIKKIMNGIKRLSKTSIVNRRMQTVKADL